MDISRENTRIKKYSQMATRDILCYIGGRARALHAPIISPLCGEERGPIIICSCPVPIVPLKNTFLARQGKEKNGAKETDQPRLCQRTIRVGGSRRSRARRMRALPSPCKSFDQIIILRKSLLMLRGVAT